MADIEEIGDGDFSLNVGALGSGAFLNIAISNQQQNDRVTIVYSSSEGLAYSAVRYIEDSSTTTIVGDINAIQGRLTTWKIPSSKKGCAAIVVNGYLMARIALYDNATPTEDCLALPLPISAIGDGDQNLPVAVHDAYPDEWAGWQSALPAGGVVRLTGFNMPRTLTSYSGATPTTVNAEGGDYGIEFTIPQNSDNLAIFDDEFWLYIR